MAQTVPKRVRTFDMDVKIVMNHILLVIEKEVCKSVDGRRGAQKRKSNDYSYKMNVINELSEGACAEYDAFNNNLHNGRMH